MTKITSYNTLFYGYSNGMTSVFDQISSVMDHFELENPDVCVLFEMPNPLQPVSADNIVVMGELFRFEEWLRGKGYAHIRQLNDKLSVWVVSKLRLLPILLLGSSTVSGAISNLWKSLPVVRDTKITSDSAYPQCLLSALDKDRSMIFGVETVNGVLPLIAIHAKCLFFNPRFARLLLFFLRAFVAQKGLVLTDINLDLSAETNPLFEDPLFTAEMPEYIVNTLRRVNLGVINKVAETATSMSYPFQALNIDCAISAQPVDIRIGGSCDVIPSSTYSSDHRWVVVENIPDCMLLRVVNNDARLITGVWAISHSELLAIYNNRLVYPALPSTDSSKSSGDIPA